jgi:hypothetical protein
MLLFIRTIWFMVVITILAGCNSAVENIDGMQNRLPQNKLPQKTTSNLIALYTFKEGTGETIHDISGIEPAVDLRIADTSATHWTAGGLSIDSVTEIRSTANADKINNAIASANALSAEAWLKPANTNQSGPARIVSLSHDPRYRNFTLGQSATRFSVRLHTTTNSENGTPEFQTPLDTATTELTHVVFTWDVSSQRASIYVNGQLASQSETIFTGDLSFTPYELVLANEINIDDNSPRIWLGEMFLVALYDRALNQDEILQHYDAGI